MDIIEEETYEDENERRFHQFVRQHIVSTL